MNEIVSIYVLRLYLSHTALAALNSDEGKYYIIRHSIVRTAITIEINFSNNINFIHFIFIVKQLIPVFNVDMNNVLIIPSY